MSPVVNLLYPALEPYRGPIYQVSFLSDSYFPSYINSKVHYHFAEERLLTQEGVAGGGFYPRGVFFRSSYVVSVAVKKSKYPLSIFCTGGTESNLSEP